VFEVFFRDKVAPLVLRVVLGVVCVYHGYLKIMADGGTTWVNGLSTFWQLAIAWGEFGAGLAILVGFRTRTAGVLILGLIIGMQLWWHGWNVFRLPIATLEPTILLLVMGLSVVLLGAGEISLDNRVGGKAPAGGKAVRKTAA
jgi:uncharacterized membrane protein YphA (DoxX/SURF4 family)